MAAWLQATLGPVGAGSLFAYAQSAAMGGYGAAIVNGVAQGGAAVAASGPWVVEAATNWWLRSPRCYVALIRKWLLARGSLLMKK